MGRRLQSRLDLLYPELSQKVQSQQLKQKRGHDNTKTLRSFQVGDFVFTENFSDPSPKRVTLSPAWWTTLRQCMVVDPVLAVVDHALVDLASLRGAGGLGG